MPSTLSVWGFDVSQLRFSFRTAIAAVLALYLAWLMGLEHPQWAAMTVWAASQPTRGMLLTKSFYRTLGTLIGTVFGVFLLYLSNGDILWISIGLSLWIGACVAVGNLIRGVASYGALLSGYTASMVVLLSNAAGSPLLELGLDRFLTVIVGVAAALVIGLAFSRKEAESDVMNRLRHISRLLLSLAGEASEDARLSDQQTEKLLLEIVQAEEAISVSALSGDAARKQRRAMQRLLHAQVELLLFLQAKTRSHNAYDAEKLRELNDLLQDSLFSEEVAATASALKRQTKFPVEIKHFLDALMLVSASQGEGQEKNHLPSGRMLALHRDWRGAGEAATRASGLTLLLGCFWWLTGWEAGSYLMLGASVMISLFSTFDNPSVFMRYVTAGQMFGALSALLCEWAFWPFVDSEAAKILLMVPFILLGAFPMAHPRTRFAAMDFNMIFLLLLQPTLHVSASFEASLQIALAVVAAPVLALLAFRFVFRTDPLRRAENLNASMQEELRSLALDSRAMEKKARWKVKLNHRVILLIRLAGRSSVSPLKGFRQGVDAVQKAQCIFELHRLNRLEEISKREAAMIRQTLKLFAQKNVNHARARKALSRCYRLLRRNRKQDLNALLM
ncbi:FUSC family protein [Thiomicrorhabdus sp.]|uniref:FUSC family protein n=1 Tax=Thiomicrorhabdus sp. TaxID=2039724 RepID=UPI0029C753CA|nr:FUSC family protein [Thiomicrorhabdus sp.]